MNEWSLLLGSAALLGTTMLLSWRIRVSANRRASRQFQEWLSTQFEEVPESAMFLFLDALGAQLEAVLRLLDQATLPERGYVLLRGPSWWTSLHAGKPRCSVPETFPSFIPEGKVAIVHWNRQRATVQTTEIHLLLDSWLQREPAMKGGEEHVLL